jgi:hypothetical protein
MKRLVVLVLFASILVGGCNSGEVSSDQVKDWQNQGREAGDVATDPHGQPVDDRTDR